MNSTRLLYISISKLNLDASRPGAKTRKADLHRSNQWKANGHFVNGGKVVAQDNCELKQHSVWGRTELRNGPHDLHLRLEGRVAAYEVCEDANLRGVWLHTRFARAPTSRTCGCIRGLRRRQPQGPRLESVLTPNGPRDESVIAPNGTRLESVLLQTDLNWSPCYPQTDLGMSL